MTDFAGAAERFFAAMAIVEGEKASENAAAPPIESAVRRFTESNTRVSRRLGKLAPFRLNLGWYAS